jgi:chemotaxis protein methyltransferase CheR
MIDSECVTFLQWALPRLQMRWPGFRKVRGQVCKRINRRRTDLGLTDISAYRRYLEHHPGEWEILDRLCVVTISRFHRDRRVFEYLRESLLPGLAAHAAGEKRNLRGWSVGCASGEEPYTIALIWHLELHDRFPEVGLDLQATDINPDVLARARAGCFTDSSLKDLDPIWVAAAFEAAADSYLLRPEYRSGIRITASDIRQEIQPGPFDLILCRNLAFTYFERPLQTDILARLLPELVPGGIFVIGGHEALPEGSWALERVEQNLPVFRKTGGSRSTSAPRN